MEGVYACQLNVLTFFGPGPLLCDVNRIDHEHTATPARDFYGKGKT